ncbi:MAG: hypothetical protein ABW061_18275 [Polyangiaceae bacterium]
MLRRSLLGLVEGLVIGLALAIACARGLGLSAPGALLAALLAGVAGFTVGLVAGRPIWARDAKTEALLKASVGALVGVGLSYVLGRWFSVPLDLSAFSFGAGPAGKLAAVSLPAIASALGLFFELDNTDAGKAKPRLATARAKQRLDTGADPDERLTDLDELQDSTAERREKR